MSSRRYPQSGGTTRLGLHDANAATERQASMSGAGKDWGAPLREDIRLLGDLLGRVITAAEGPELFDLEERVRALSKRLRSTHNPATSDELRALLDDLTPAQEHTLVRAF